MTVETAQALVSYYLSRLDLFLYALSSQYEDLDAVRRASPTLLAAMCTVAAYNDTDHSALFEVCNREYRHLVSSALFEKRDTAHIRALCSGSFWLPDASRILSSDAIRRAADSKLHSYFSSLTAAETDGFGDTPSAAPTDKERDYVRLWYLLFICDQHLSILHNRDSLVRRDLDVLERRERFLATPNTNNQDVRLMSQVSLLVIMGQIRDIFGSETTKPMPRSHCVQFNHFSSELDQWYSRFSGIFGESFTLAIWQIC